MPFFSLLPLREAVEYSHPIVPWGMTLAGLGWEGGPCGRGKQAHHPLTWSCMMQLDSAASLPACQHHQAAGSSNGTQQLASQRPAQRQSGPPRNPSTARHHTPTAPLPDLVVRRMHVLCFTHFARPPSPFVKSERASQYAPMEGKTQLLSKYACVSRRLALFSRLIFASLWAHQIVYVWVCAHALLSHHGKPHPICQLDG